MGAIGSLASIVKMFSASPPTVAQLIPLDDFGNERTSGKSILLNGWSRGFPDDKFEFQYFPEQITDNRGVDYASKKIPGGSHPLYQFISGTDRTISFTAFFTADENPDPGDFFDKLTKGFSLASLSSVASGVFGRKHTVDVAAQLAHLRSFTYPTYRDGYAKAPPVLRLYLPGSNITGTVRGGTEVPGSVDVIMTQCDITYEAFYQQGGMRIAAVNLSFNETIQVGDNWKFVDGFDVGSSF